MWLSVVRQPPWLQPGGGYLVPPFAAPLRHERPYPPKSRINLSHPFQVKRNILSHIPPLNASDFFGGFFDVTAAKSALPCQSKAPSRRYFFRLRRRKKRFRRRKKHTRRRSDPKYAHTFTQSMGILSPKVWAYFASVLRWGAEIHRRTLPILRRIRHFLRHNPANYHKFGSWVVGFKPQRTQRSQRNVVYR